MATRSSFQAATPLNAAAPLVMGTLRRTRTTHQSHEIKPALRKIDNSQPDAHNNWTAMSPGQALLPAQEGTAARTLGADGRPRRHPARHCRTWESKIRCRPRVLFLRITKGSARRITGREVPPRPHPHGWPAAAASDQHMAPADIIRKRCRTAPHEHGKRYDCRRH